MTIHDAPGRVIRRLKTMGLVPQDKAIRIVPQRKRSLPWKWSAEDAVSGEQYHVGGAEGVYYMCTREWSVDHLTQQGWVILIPGDPLPPEPASRPNVKGFGKLYPERHPRT